MLRPVKRPYKFTAMSNKFHKTTTYLRNNTSVIAKNKNPWPSKLSAEKSLEDFFKI